MHTHYDRLKVAPDAPAEVIRAAYRALSQRHHPDRNPGDAQAARTMQALNEAYAVLSDPARRRAYDASLGHGRRVARGASGPAGPRPAPRPAAQPAPAAVEPVAAPARHRNAGIAAVLALLALGAVLAMWPTRGRRPAASRSAVTALDEPEWAIHGLDSPARVQVRAQAAVAATPAGAALPPPRTDITPLPSPPVAPAPSSAPAPPPTLVVADPNGRPWPFQAGYVPGLPQGHADGLASVTIDNRGGASAVFVKLVSLDAQPALAVRHVYLPAMDHFTIGSLRPGRYALHYRDLFTGRMSRSQPFELHRFDGPASTRYSEIDITLYPVPGGTLQTEPLSAAEF